MQSVESSILKVDIPETMTIKRPTELTLLLELPMPDSFVQTPRIVISLNKIDNYNEFEGENLFQKFRKSISDYRFRIEEKGFEEKKLNGKSVYIIHSFTKTTFQKDDFDLTYFCALILINEQYCIEFFVDFEAKDTNQLLEIYETILSSLQWNDDITECDKYYKIYIEAIENQNDSYANNEFKLEEEWDAPIAPFEIPNDGNEVFQIGGLTFSILQEESSVETTSLSKELLITLVAQTKDVKKGEDNLLLEINEYADDDEKGRVSISFPLVEIYQNGTPTGSFNFKEDKCKKPYSSIRHEGFEYTLDFFGNVTLQNGWLGLNGYMKASYNEKPIFEVKIYKHFNISTLNWKNYRFTSLEEALQAPKEVVEWLEINNPTFEVLPDSVYEFKNLKSLTIYNSDWDNKIKFDTISDRIAELKHLECLHIANANIAVIPKKVGKLKKLANLSFANCAIKEIPDSVMLLPNLMYLFLRNNQIEVIPENINLPSLYSADLDDNLLKTVPEELIKQPNINSLHLQKNPLEYLSSAFNNFKGLQLSIDDKKRLFDYEYKGANESGTVTWNDSVYYCSEKDVLFKKLNSIIKKNKLLKYQDALQSFTKKSICFSHTIPEDYTEIGNHRFGGMPDLPLDIEYPSFIDTYEGERECKYEFLGQINCEKISHLQDYLPRKGMLFFFIETIHNIYDGNKKSTNVIYVEDTNRLVAGNRFNFSIEDYYDMFESQYSGYKADTSVQLSIPTFYSIRTNAYLFNEKTEILRDVDSKTETFLDNLEQAFRDEFTHSHGINVYGFTQHESPELQASLNLKGNPEDWTILLKISSSGDFQWGDAGDLFFVVHKSDLAKLDFSNVFLTMESS